MVASLFHDYQSGITRGLKNDGATDPLCAFSVYCCGVNFKDDLDEVLGLGPSRLLNIWCIGSFATNQQVSKSQCDNIDY